LFLKWKRVGYSYYDDKKMNVREKKKRKNVTEMFDTRKHEKLDKQKIIIIRVFLPRANLHVLKKLKK